jgi:hypothetical protein
MIGTLVVILPSDFTGGAIEVEHGDERITYRDDDEDREVRGARECFSERLSASAERGDEVAHCPRSGAPKLTTWTRDPAQFD